MTQLMFKSVLLCNTSLGVRVGHLYVTLDRNADFFK